MAYAEESMAEVRSDEVLLSPACKTIMGQGRPVGPEAVAPEDREHWGENWE